MESNDALGMRARLENSYSSLDAAQIILDWEHIVFLLHSSATNKYIGGCGTDCRTHQCICKSEKDNNKFTESPDFRYLEARRSYGSFAGMAARAVIFHLLGPTDLICFIYLLYLPYLNFNIVNLN